jgi:hypothetical protein
MKKAEILEIIDEANKKEIDNNTEKVKGEYHQLNDLEKPQLSELIDDYILGKLDSRRKTIFEEHLPSCERCRKELAIMRLFIQGVKELGDEIL